MFFLYSNSRSEYRIKKEKEKLTYNLYFNILGPFGIPIWATIFTFQTHLHTFSHTFSPIRISKNYKNLISNYSTKHPLSFKLTQPEHTTFRLGWRHFCRTKKLTIADAWLQDLLIPRSGPVCEKQLGKIGAYLMTSFQLCLWGQGLTLKGE